MSPESQRGVTLIELMMVMLIMSILAAVAIPIYAAYTTRTKVAEGFSLASVAQQAVVEYENGNGIFPSSNLQAGIDPPTELRGSFVGSVSIGANGIVQVNFDDPALAGGQLILTPTQLDHTVVWQCHSPNISTPLLPKECR